MKPNYAEVRRMILLALVCWKDFLNTLSSPLYSKFHLPDEEFFSEIYREFSHCDEIREALILIAIYWDRVPDKYLALGMIGLRFSKPHTIFNTTLVRSLYNDECARLVSGVVDPIDEIECPIIFSGRFYPEIEFDLEDTVRMNELVSEYDKSLLELLCTPEPYIRAGIELQLVRRGFKI